MKKRILAQLNHATCGCFFLGLIDVYGDGTPGGAIEHLPPDEPLISEHHRWRWTGTAYEQTPDYRGKQVYRPDGTTYYPDTWGPLSAGDSLDPPPPPPPTPEDEEKRREANFNTAINARLQVWIAECGWDSLDRVLAQTGLFALDAQTVQAAYDETWAAAIPLFPAVIAGVMTIEEAVSALPALVWPEPAA